MEVSHLSACPNFKEDNYIAAMVLSGVGDALGYNNGRWEFCHSGPEIYKELQQLGGLEKIKVKLPHWIVSDDTVMHLATGEALIKCSKSEEREQIFVALAIEYKKCMKDMANRAPGITCMSSVSELRPNVKYGYRIPFSPRGGGCGAAMRAMCIGLRYPRPEQLEDLIAISVESGRMTHHHPTGYLGSLAAALFTAFAVQGRPSKSWGKGLMETIPLALKYIESTSYCVEESKSEWNYFQNAWETYLSSRNLSDGQTDPIFPEPYGFEERDKFVKQVSFSGFGGASGHDAPMIAYDAYLAAGSSWKELCYRSMFHGGDSDSTGVMAACWYGVTYGLNDVPSINHKKVEYRDRLVTVARKLYTLAKENN
ncbi:protein ADP-ribosylarginine hydrolase [Biomphalaria glabrata]|uniref:ADP-ribosylhydrolase ARH1 n=1 Tax=Biomphalaria glabrata TaxID=6526 RepID=A0A2C9JGW0_BIOGL|nr:protein ADP-ribosylarginine hydrolase-like [Biomphalaria glabrata]KAI8794141.1 protein ADP-ribosylarginine hydrolase [Biomphalaria glabrata]